MKFLLSFLGEKKKKEIDCSKFEIFIASIVYLYLVCYNKSFFLIALEFFNFLSSRCWESLSRILFFIKYIYDNLQFEF